ncbi:MAG: M60 family metallopeptidase [Muribaculaceae bacterium]|nr:M60 family metallopeptidase [Muribaculaceae bacterium]
MKRRFTTFLIALTAVFAVGMVVAKVNTSERAAVEVTDGSGPQDGHVYRIVNLGYGDAMVAPAGGNVTCTAVDDDNEAQLWIAEANPAGTGFYFRNYKTGFYMTSSCARSATWQAEFTLTPDENKVLMSVKPIEGGYVINTVNGINGNTDEKNFGFAHEDGGKKVVGWNTESVNSKWKLIDQTDITPAMVAEKRKTWVTSVSVIEPGKAYKLINYNYGHAMTPSGNGLVGSAPNDGDENQIWIVDNNPSGDGYVLRNYNSGRIVSSSMASGSRWSTIEQYIPNQDRQVLNFKKTSKGFGIIAAGSAEPDSANDNYTFAHEDGQANIVGWNLNSNPSLWLFVPQTEITSADIDARRQTWDTFKKYVVESALAAIFEDAACTVLTPKYAAMDPASYATDPNVLALPEGLRPMVTKVRTGNWAETDPYNGNEWDSTHAKKLRVMLAEPFSESSGVAALVGIQAHGDVNNPTGIVTDKGTTFYVMLDDEPAPGTELNIAARTGEGVPLISICNTTDGIVLHKGLNIINCNADLAHMIVYYTVRTNNRQRAVSDYQPIKMHFEGGSLNGYFNYEGDELYTPDTNEDWLYYRDRARHPMFALISKYNTLLIHLNDLEDGTKCLKSLCSPERYAQGKFDLRKTMEAWDDLYKAEALIMGWLPDEVIEQEKAAGRDFYDPLEGDPVAPSDYYKYLNNRHLGMSMRDCGFMNATWWRTAYNPGTISSIICEFPTGDLWGPAHEMGHLNQGPIKICGTTEESCNIFSNAALLSRGKHTSRADYPSVQRRRFNNGENFLQHDVWGTTRMYLQLWLYYHVVGHDKRFYPRLFELLRQNPLRRTPAPGYEGVNPIFAKDDLLHFAKMACEAAGEDLTDFFDAWGFLSVHNGLFVDDYSLNTLYLSAEEIAEWRQEIAQLAAEKGWKKNRSILFIDDRVNSDKQSYEFDKNRCGSMGGLKEFSEGATVNGEYTFVLTGNKVEISGATGGVGFIIHDENDHLIGFSNDPVFEINDAAVEKIKSGNYTFHVIDHANNASVVVDAVNNGSLEQRLQAMDVLLAEAEKVLALSDPNGLNPGYLKPEYVADLQAIYDEIKAKRVANEITVDNSTALYNSLYEQYAPVKNIQPTAENTIPVIDGGVYVFTDNMRLRGLGIIPNAAGTQLLQNPADQVDLSDPAQQWVFEATDEEGYFYIRNVKYNKYIGKTNADRGIIPLIDTPMKQLVVYRQFGAFSISPEGSNHDSLHADDNNRLTRWDSEAPASRWTLTMADDWEYIGVVADLEHYVQEAENLMNEVSDLETGDDGQVSFVPKDEYQYVSEENLETLSTLLDRINEILRQINGAENVPQFVAKFHARAKNAPEYDHTELLEELKSLLEQLKNLIEEIQAGKTHNYELLKDLVEECGQLIEKIGTYTEISDPVALNEGHFYSNACHPDGGDAFTSWNVLLDNNFDTYFHSTYQNKETIDGLDHYIRVELPEAITEPTDLQLTYVTRKNNDYNWFPAGVVIEYSEDGTNWTKALIADVELPFASATRYTSVPFTVPAGTSYIRFMVTDNRQSAGNPRSDKVFNHPYFAISEFGLYNYDMECRVNSDKLTDEDIEAFKQAVKQYLISVKPVEKDVYSNPRIDEAYEALQQHYPTLVALSKMTTGIDEICLGDDTTLESNVIYTVDGKRISKITVPGIYVVNGRKVLVKK